MLIKLNAPLNVSSDLRRYTNVLQILNIYLFIYLFSIYSIKSSSVLGCRNLTVTVAFSQNIACY